MKIIAQLGPLDRHGCREVEFRIETGGHALTADTYTAGSLYLRAEHAEPILRRFEGASGGFVGDVEVRTSGGPVEERRTAK